MKNRRPMMLGFLLLALSVPALANMPENSVSRWEFDVYLNDKRVGQHHYEVSRTDGIEQVRSEASFNYKILFISAYRFQHSNSERWSDNCLLGFDAETNANGKRFDISGQRRTGSFTVDDGESSFELPECVMSFAYWNRDFLEQSSLLNPQTGEYVEVSVDDAGADSVVVRGEVVPATRYRLTAYGVDLTLWYSDDDRWLALESVAKGGHRIRYELS